MKWIIAAISLISAGPSALAASDPCKAPGIDFPAFTFRGATEATEEQIYVTDANGKCVRPLYEVTTQMGSDAASAVFSYPVAGTADVGRIVWHQGGRSIYSLSFLVSGTSVTPYGAELLLEINDGWVRGLDMSKNGSIVYAGLNPSRPEDTTRVIAITFSDHSYRDLYAGPVDSEIESIAVDEGGAIFVRHSVPIQQNVFTQIVRVDPGCSDPSCVAVIATDESALLNDSVSGVAVSLDDDRLVYEHSGITTCSPVLKVASNDGSPVSGAAPPFHGRHSSWYRGKILTDGFKIKRNGSCIISSTISRFDPETGAETILVRGYDPDGR